MYELLHALLPQFIQQSRKALIWFLGLSASGILEGCKAIGPALQWSPDRIAFAAHELGLVQAALIAIIGLWTSQIAHEDAALKTGLPPPAPQQGVQATMRLTNPDVTPAAAQAIASALASALGGNQAPRSPGSAAH